MELEAGYLRSVEGCVFVYLLSVEGLVMQLGLAGLVTVGHEPFVTQRQLHTRLNEAYPTVWLEVCVRACVGVS